MKTFTATQLNKSPQEVFAAAKEDGKALIEHDRYMGGRFAIVWNKDFSKGDQLIQAKYSKHLADVAQGLANRFDPIEDSSGQSDS